jgi:hypothetical protein
MEETQNEVQDTAPSPTARLAFDVMLHKPVWFDWAAEVDEVHGLSPVTHNTLQPEPADPAPAPINPVPNNVVVDPDYTAFANAVPADPDPVDPALVSPINPAPGDPAIDPD